MEIIIGNKIVLPISELEFTTSRSSGPGGQHVNKVNSRVTLRFDVRSSSTLTNQQKRRIVSCLHARVTKEGVLHLHSQKYRSQSSNRKELIGRFQALLGQALRSRRPRVPTKVPKGAHEKRLQQKKRRATLKRKRSPQPFED